MKFTRENWKMNLEENGGSELKTLDRLKQLYPNVTEPLPLCWSSTEKNNSIGLSNSNLRVHYKGNCTMIFTFASSTSGSQLQLRFLLRTISFRRWKVTQRCRLGQNHVSHPGQLRTLLLRGEDNLKGSRWLHGDRFDGLLSLKFQNEQTARWERFDWFVPYQVVNQHLLRCKHSRLG